MAKRTGLPVVVGRKMSRIIPFRVSPEEVEAYQKDAARRRMTLSGWLRSAAATFIVCGRNSVTVPAGGVVEPEFVAAARAEGDRGNEIIAEAEMEYEPPAPAADERNRRKSALKTEDDDL